MTDLTWATPCESRRTTPICEGVRPLRASLKMCSLTSSGEVLSQRGAERLYGSAEPACCVCVEAVSYMQGRVGDT